MSSHTISMPTGIYKREYEKPLGDRINIESIESLSYLIPSPMKKVISSFWIVLISKVE